MLKDSHAFSGFSVDDISAAKKFYGEILGVEVEDDAMGLTLKIAGGATIFVYPKPNHQPASFTILNFPVADIDQTAADLAANGVTLEQYSGLPGVDEQGIQRGRESGHGPDIAWFKDPAGNILSILQS